MSNKSLKDIDTASLLKILKNKQTKETNVDPDYLNHIFNELNSRELTAEETKTFESITNAPFEDILVDEENLNNNISKNNEKTTQENINKYPALKAIILLISIVGYSAIIIGIFVLAVMSKSDQTETGLLYLGISIIVALFFIAFANLIRVFVDIEKNTRK